MSRSALAHVVRVTLGPHTLAVSAQVAVIAAVSVVGLGAGAVWLGVALGGGTATSGAPGGGPGMLPSAPSSTAVAVAMAGTVAGALAPGVMTPLDLELTNPSDVAVTVTRLTVSVQAVDAAPAVTVDLACGLVDFAVDQAAVDLGLVVPARSTSTLSSLGVPRDSWPRVGMVDRDVNQDGCQRAAIRLEYTASVAVTV